MLKFKFEDLIKGFNLFKNLITKNFNKILGFYYNFEYKTFKNMKYFDFYNFVIFLHCLGFFPPIFKRLKIGKLRI